MKGLEEKRNRTGGKGKVGENGEKTERGTLIKGEQKK